MEQIIEYRNYAAAKVAYDLNPRATGDLVQMVRLIDFELAQEDLDRG